MGCHFLLQGIFLTWGLNLCLLHWQVDSLPLPHLETPAAIIIGFYWPSLLLSLPFLAAQGGRKGSIPALPSSGQMVLERDLSEPHFLTCK